ncbi:hypothetical protein B0H14DRAFT_2548139 [Mycena olivaceomarginata]|nr:hypothetical protein B0H14DRAFT_2548139 [Mycena olivaceomarginata]
MIQEIPVTVTVCTGGVGVGCAAIPIVSDTCVNLSGGLSFLNKQIATAIIPGAFALYCMLHRQGKHCSEVVLRRGTWNFFNVPGPSGTTNFNDLTSSLTCSPI